MWYIFKRPPSQYWLRARLELSALPSKYINDPPPPFPSSFFFLPPALPPTCRPGAYVIAASLGVFAERMAGGLVLCTLLSGPLLFVSSIILSSKADSSPVVPQSFLVVGSLGAAAAATVFLGFLQIIADARAASLAQRARRNNASDPALC